MDVDQKPHSLRVFVKLTSAEKQFAVQVRYSETVYTIKRQVQQQDATLLADSGMLLYEGRVLKDTETVSSCLLGCENHTLLYHMVAKPATRALTTSPSDHRSARTSPYLTFSQHWQTGNAEPNLEEYDEEMVSFSRRVPLLQEGDSTDLLLGVAVGFLLGCVAGLCLMESGLSGRLKLGVLIGITCNVCVALLRLATTPTQT